jgi:hypothetical protein
LADSDPPKCESPSPYSSWPPETRATKDQFNEHRNPQSLRRVSLPDPEERERDSQFGTNSAPSLNSPEVALSRERSSSSSSAYFEQTPRPTVNPQEQRGSRAEELTRTLIELEDRASPIQFKTRTRHLSTLSQHHQGEQGLTRSNHPVYLQQRNESLPEDLSGRRSSSSDQASYELSLPERERDPPPLIRSFPRSSLISPGPSRPTYHPYSAEKRN